MLNDKKFVFPAFSFQINGRIVEADAGYITWSDLKQIYEDSNLSANLRKANKLAFWSLHSFNNKQNENLALYFFDHAAIAASKSYFPKRKDMHNFLTLINM